MSLEDSTAPTLARLRQARGSQEATVRWLQRLAPLLLVVFVVTAGRADPGPGLTGRGLAIAIAAAAFPVGVLARNATLGSRAAASAGCAVVVLVASVLLMALQPDGPGAEGVLLGVLFVARLLPGRSAVPGLVVALVAIEVIAWAVGRGDLAVLAVFAGFYGILFLAYRLREANKQAEQLLAELNESLAAQSRAAGLAERQRLAREMHDVLAHSLSGLLLQLEGARMLVAADPTDPRLPEAVNRAHRLGRSGLEEARRAIGMLRDDELPGPEGLARLAAQFQQDRRIPCRVMVTGEPHPLGSEARVALYRVTQEALTNITRHAVPGRVEVRLAYGPTATRLTVEDFTTADRAGPPTPGGGGYGLTGMRERAELLGGTLIAEATHRGFRVALDVPR